MGERVKIYSWMLFDWACQPIHTLIATFIFGPYFVSAVASNPVEGQALIGTAVTASGVIVAVFSPILGAMADQTQKRKPWIMFFSMFFLIATFSLWFAEPNMENTFWILVAYTIGFVAVDFSTVFNNSMMPSLVKPSNLGKLSGSGWGLGDGRGALARHGGACSPGMRLGCGLDARLCWVLRWRIRFWRWRSPLQARVFWHPWDCLRVFMRRNTIRCRRLQISLSPHWLFCRAVFIRSLPCPTFCKKSPYSIQFFT